MSLIITEEEFRSWTDERRRARLINCLSGIKSAVLIGSLSQDGQTNLAIFSSLFHLGADPALMGFIIRPDISARHTLENILESKYYSINLLPYKHHLEGHHTSARFPKETSEFKACGFNEEYFENSSIPFVKESKVKWLMKFVRSVDIEENGTHLIIGQVKEIHLPQEILAKDGALDISQTDPTLVTGLDCYHRVKKGTRYSYAKPNLVPHPLT